MSHHKFEDMAVRDHVAGVRESAELLGGFTPAQQAKVDAIEALLVELGTPTIDEELDAMIAALTEIRDRP